MPVDLRIDRKDAMLYISRSDAACLDSKPPSLDFYENWENFMRNHNRYR